jgi:hypothetical protein
VDDQFQQLQMLQEDGGTPGFVAEVVTLFCDDANRIISELAALLYALFVPDYPVLLLLLLSIPTFCPMQTDRIN